jgi:AcrR family transcriptional regulator
MAVTVDGRHLRRHQNRDAVIDALVSFWEEGELTPGTAAIAERAGISARSLFRYFDDTDDLARAAIDRQLEAASPLVEIDAVASDPTARKIDRAVTARSRLFDAIAPGARAGRAVQHDRPVVAEQLRAARARFRRQVRELFEPELRDRPELLPVLDVLLSFETRDLLRVDQGLSPTKTSESLVAALTALLKGPR